jgi:hypothetical protein
MEMTRYAMYLNSIITNRLDQPIVCFGAGGHLERSMRMIGQMPVRKK